MIYDPEKKTISHKKNTYYFYNGKPEVDWQTMIVMSLLRRGFVPQHDNQLTEIYLEVCAGDIYKGRTRGSV